MDNKVLDQMMMALMGASPTDDQRMANLDDQPVVQILPDANVVKIGGQSFIDRGRAAVFSLIDEIVENLLRHKMIIDTAFRQSSQRNSRNCRSIWRSVGPAFAQECRLMRIGNPIRRSAASPLIAPIPAAI